MSFVTTIRDYVETLNTLSESMGPDFTLQAAFSASVSSLFQTLKAGLLYLVTFQWIRDFTLLPIVLPQISSSILKERFFLETPSQVFFEFLEIPDLNQNKFLLGLLNSFFLCLPFSIVHILSIRRLLIQGIPSGVYSIGGYLLGQILFLTFTVFGVRQILIPWLTFEPLMYVVGVILIFRIIYAMTQENFTELQGWFLPQYKNFFLTSFLLAWCEQSSVFQYLGNLTLNSNVTLLESFSSNSSVSSFFAHLLYIFGICCGCVIFTLLWGVFFLQVKNWCVLYTRLFLSSFLQLVNKTTFVVGLALSLSSIPFYGFDYLITGPLGFVSQDDLFKNTVFEQRNGKVKSTAQLLSDMETNFEYLHIDVSPFDRGNYLVPDNVPQRLSFEDLNYRGEFDWTGRSNNQGIADSRSSFFTLSKLMKKQKKTQSESSVQSDISQELKRNLVIGERNEETEKTLLETNLEILQRFRDWYSIGTEESENAQLIEVSQELSNVSFPPDFLINEPVFEKDIQQKFKTKYYANPVYKALLTLDIDLFLKRQPENFQLSPDQEKDLNTKRKLLESYYDSLRYYSQLPYTEAFEDFFDGAKSFSNKVYNQQFKGTLRSVRRLFSLTPEDSNLQASEKVLKFDQPLYEFPDKQTFSPYHEELINQSKNSKVDSLVENPLVTGPLYAGWDETFRKFVITNKFLPRTLAGSKVNIDPELRRNFSQEPSNTKGQKIKFTAWPLSGKTLSNLKGDSNISFVTLFEQKTKYKSLPKDIFGDIYSTLPANVELYARQQGQVFDSLAPKRGGFVWPGNENKTFTSFFK